jgi:cytochrome c553
MSKYFSVLLFSIILQFGMLATSHAKGDSKAGKSKAIACQVCHGKGGRSFNPLYPVLAGQHAQYIVKQLKAFQSKERKNPIMNEIAAPLTEEDMEDLGAFFNSQ